MPSVKGKSRNQDSEPDAQVESAADFGREQASVSGRKLSSSRVPLAKPIQQHVSQLASDFRREHGLQDRRIGDRIARLFRASITPRSSRGRRPTEVVVIAARLLQQRVLWSEIYVEVIPLFEDMHKYEREYHTRQLRRNVNRFLKRRGIRSPVPPGRSRKVSKKPTSD